MERHTANDVLWEDLPFVDGRVLHSPSSGCFLKSAHSDSVGAEIRCGGRENDQTRSTGDSAAPAPGKYPAVIESRTMLKMNLMISYLQTGFAFYSICIYSIMPANVPYI